jgi:hypothetical protein
MAGPDNNEKLEALSAKPMQLPRADQTAIMSAQGVVQLPARPSEAATDHKELEALEARKAYLAKKEHRVDDKVLHEHLQHIRSDDVRLFIDRSQQQGLKALTQILLAGHDIPPERLSVVESIVRLSGNATLVKLAADGSLTQDALAQNLLHLIAQHRSLGSSAEHIAMCDSLENQLTQILRYLNPSIRVQQQQQEQNNNTDDDSSAAGPEKVEDDDRDSSLSEQEDLDLDADYSPSPRSKKGKAKAKARDRRSRFRKWLARMMRVFRGNSAVLPRAARAQIVVAKQEQDRRFIKTVRVFGRVTNRRTKIGLGGVKVISSSMGTAETSADGSFAFENVTEGISYSLAPLKSGYLFTPISVNDIALDSREHNFFMLEE